MGGKWIVDLNMKGKIIFAAFQAAEKILCVCVCVWSGLEKDYSNTWIAQIIREKIGGRGHIKNFHSVNDTIDECDRLVIDLKIFVIFQMKKNQFLECARKYHNQEGKDRKLFRKLVKIYEITGG